MRDRINGILRFFRNSETDVTDVTRLFVSIAEHVSSDVGIIERDRVEIVDGSSDDLWIETLFAAPVRRRFVPADRINDAPQCGVPLPDSLDRFMQTLVLVFECSVA
jgi:hypothetical protein